MGEGKKELPINKGRVMNEQARGTIKSVLDAIVELVTNSDDSYKNLEQSGFQPENPIIKIIVTRRKGGICEELTIVDNASGMTRKKLIQAIEFAGETSGFEEGKKVRGFFGRGLKESIIALGKGTIISWKDGKTTGIKIWVEQNERGCMPYYEELTDNQFLETQVKQYSQDSVSGTIVSIVDVSQDYKVPEHLTLKNQITSHYQLRDINSDPHRIVQFIFKAPEKGNSENTSTLRFEPPLGKEVLNNKKLNLGNEEVYLTLYESDVALEFPNDILGLAGLLIKSEGAILDNKLFGYSGDQAALYFYGHVEVPGIAFRLRKKEVLVSPNRNGLDWRHEFLQKLNDKLEVEMAQEIERKKKELLSTDQKEMSDMNKALIDKLKNIMNDWAMEEGLDWESPIDPGKLDTMVIKPELCEIEVGFPRILTIYLPKEISEVYPLEGIIIKSDNGNIRCSKPKLPFKEHRKYPDILMGQFEVLGNKEAEEGIISCELGDYSAISIVQVVDKITHQQQKKKRNLSGKKGGFLRDIKPDEELNPYQRVFYDSHLGEIRIFVNFPGVNNYLKPGLVGAESLEGSVMLAELVTEVFCRAVAIKGLKDGTFLTMGFDRDSFIDSYNRALFDLQKKYAERLHKAIISHYRS